MTILAFDHTDTLPYSDVAFVRALKTRPVITRNPYSGTVYPIVQELPRPSLWAAFPLTVRGVFAVMGWTLLGMFWGFCVADLRARREPVASHSPDPRQLPPGLFR